MRKHIIIMLISLSFLATAAAQSVETIAMPESGSPFVAFRVWFQAGSQDDPPGKEGLAVLTSSLLAQGATREKSYDQILDALYPMATNYSVSVDKEMTVFSGLVHRDNLDGFYALFRDAILKPGFQETDFARLKAQQLSFVSQLRRYSSDEELAKELLFNRIYQGTRYEHPEEGYVHSVRGLSLDDVKLFYANHYRRDGVVVAVGGGYPPSLVEQVRADFENLPAGKAPQVAAPQPKAVEGIHVLLVEKDTRATAISFGYPFGLLRSHDDFPPMALVNSWLGEHRNSASHLYQVIREARGMNYGDYSYIEAWPGGHMGSLPPVNTSRRSQIFQIWIRPISSLKAGDLHDRALFATRAALREFEKLTTKGLSQEQFELTRGFLRNYTVNHGATLSRRLGYRVDDRFYGLADPGYLAGIRPNLDRMTLEEVNGALRRHLKAGNFWLVMITQDAEGMKRKLLSGEPTPISYPSPKPDSILQEDREIASFPIPVKAENIHIVKVQEVFE